MYGNAFYLFFLISVFNLVLRSGYISKENLQQFDRSLIGPVNMLTKIPTLPMQTVVQFTSIKSATELKKSYSSSIKSNILTQKLNIKHPRRYIKQYPPGFPIAFTNTTLLYLNKHLTFLLKSNTTNFCMCIQVCW